jgi:hypothetical protein
MVDLLVEDAPTSPRDWGVGVSGRHIERGPDGTFLGRLRLAGLYSCPKILSRLSGAWAKTGKRMAANIAIIAMTTISLISVKPRL